MNALKNRLEILGVFVERGEVEVPKDVARSCVNECMAIAEAMGELAGLVTMLRLKKKGEPEG